MSRTIKGKKPQGFDFWSKRCFGFKCAGYGVVAKQITKMKEKTAKKKELKKILNDI